MKPAAASRAAASATAGAAVAPAGPAPARRSLPRAPRPSRLLAAGGEGACELIFDGVSGPFGASLQARVGGQV